ncbi:MAG: hypothetical protein NT075_22805 [Chloroflexi bacterium]|nr:hypothetical protein [Chloroflexota bacterium]
MIKHVTERAKGKWAWTGALGKSPFPVQRPRHLARMATAGMLGIVLLSGLLLLGIPQPIQAAAPLQQPTTNNPHQGDTMIQAHKSLIATAQTTERMWGVLEQVAGTNDPHAGHQSNAAINTSLLDFALPGTQPGGLTTPLAESGSCTGCHVDHIRDNFNGSMMTNGVRDPLFRAALVIANKDAGFGGDLCIRCHSPTAWLNNRSATPGDPASTDGRLINAEDLHGIPCASCHRMVPPTALNGEAPGDAAERVFLTGPFMTGNSAYIIDRNDVRRGPFNVASAPHAVAQSSFLRSAELCATCHDIDNPLLTFDTASGEFKLNTLNTPANVTDRLFPLDRSYSEWKLSTFGGSGVSGLNFPGLKRSTGTEGGPITVCQDCHMPMVTAPIAGGGPTRTVGKHQWVGANVNWQDGISKVWDNVVADTRFDATQTANNKALGLDLLQRAAQLNVAIVNGQLEVKITNNSGHKLPTGYAEGRRMWLEIYELRGSTPVFTSGLMAGVVGPLISDPYLKKYEVKLGLSDAHAQNVGRPELAGEGFHIILNNKVFKDNRIPPRGFSNAAFATRDMQPVGANYADGQYWDTTYYPVHPEADQISVRLMYQTASTEYLDFLASEANANVSDAVRGPTNWGQIIADLRNQNIGKPVAIASAHLFMPRQFVAPSGVDTGFCTDSAQPCKTINYAMSQAVDGGEIRIAAGLYKEQIQMSKPISLTGGFTVTNWITPAWTTNQTILDGQKAYRPLTINADNVRVDGFIVRNGRVTGFDPRGGGIFIGGVNVVDRARLVNLRLENNVASTVDGGNGGGLAVEMGNTFHITGELTLSNVTVFSNTASTGSLNAGGGGISIQAVGNSVLNVEMVNVVVQGNTAGNDFSSSGGGIAMRLNGGRATLRQSRILNNHAAKIKTFLGGPSRGGGLFLTDGNLLLENVLIAGNDGERGDAMWIESGNIPSSTVAMNYVTIADNYRIASDAADAVRIDGTQVLFVLANTLISGNPIAFTAQENIPPPAVDFHNVLIDNNVGVVISGTVTTNGTPLRGSAGYVNAGAGDYHLTAASNAIDQGNGLPPLIDLDGAFRPQGATTEIGAYEFTPAGLNNQAISFTSLPDKLVSDPPFSVSATASSGLPVSFATLTPGVCTINGNTVTLITTGTCTIQAAQPGNASFNPAPPVAQAFAVKSTQKSDQTITFGKPADKILGDLPFTLSASASSGLPVSFTGNTPGVCTVSGNTWQLLDHGHTRRQRPDQSGDARVTELSGIEPGRWRHAAHLSAAGGALIDWRLKSQQCAHWAPETPATWVIYPTHVAGVRCLAESGTA